MAKDYARKYKRKKTRLTKLEEKRAIKQAIYYGALSILLIIVIIFKGIPAVIKLTLFIGERKWSQEPKEKSDLVAPAPPTLQPLTEATNSASLILKGMTEGDALVKIYLNGEQIKEIEADDEGDFTIRNISLKEGKNELKARAIDKEDNESEYSSIMEIILDTEPPSLTLDSPNDGDEFFDEEKEITLKGATEKSASLYINQRLAIIDSQGSFSFTYELKEGDNEIEMRAVDLAGNQTVKNIKVSYTP